MSDDLLAAWDLFNAAIDRVVCALPSQLTAAANALESARREFRETLQREALKERRRP